MPACYGAYRVVKEEALTFSEEEAAGYARLIDEANVEDDDGSLINENRFKCHDAPSKLRVLMSLRRFCDHPLLSSGSCSGFARPALAGTFSTKVARVVEIVVECRAMEEKVLVFSEWTDMLDAIEGALALVPISCCRRATDRLHSLKQSVGGVRASAPGWAPGGHSMSGRLANWGREQIAAFDL